MATTVAKAAARTHAKTLRSDLHSVRAGSHMLRIGANPSLAREVAREAMARTGLTQKAMAITAGIPESVLSEALNERGRNLEIDWLICQDAAFVLALLDGLRGRLGLTDDDKRALKAARIGELVRLLVEVA